MFTQKTIGVLGAGNMGEALLRGLLRASLVEPDRLIASSLEEDRLGELRDDLGIRVTADNRQLVQDADIVIVCTKPHTVLPLLTSLRSEFRPTQTLFSIAAGVSLRAIGELLVQPMPLVRVMPNTPSLIGEGVSAFCLGGTADDSHAQIAAKLFGALGHVHRVEEEQMDAITAVSGSGPAYLFYLLEALHSAADSLGLPQALGRDLVNQTIRGSVLLAEASDQGPSDLRRGVTSPGGTTEAALRVLEDAGFEGLFVRALAAARDRSLELSGTATEEDAGSS